MFHDPESVDEIMKCGKSFQIKRKDPVYRLEEPVDCHRESSRGSEEGGMTGDKGRC